MCTHQVDFLNIVILYLLSISGEGDAFGNLSIGPESGVHKSAVTIRSITCVEIHILYLKDLNELLELFPDFSEELLKKTKSILKKSVLTSQVNHRRLFGRRSAACAIFD